MLLTSKCQIRAKHVPKPGSPSLDSGSCMISLEGATALKFVPGGEVEERGLTADRYRTEILQDNVFLSGSPLQSLLKKIVSPVLRVTYHSAIQGRREYNYDGMA